MNILTFDIEHWHEGYRYRGVDGWQCHPPRDGIVVEGLLDELAETRQRATLFVTGKFAEEFPGVVTRAAAEGHEIASHSYAHNVLPRVADVDAFRKDLAQSVTILEALSGQKVKGYRAPKWSISRESRDGLLGVLAELGLRYDSSMVPGILGARSSECVPHRVLLFGGGSVWEVPPATFSLLGLRIPVAGGLYFRLLPEALTRHSLSHGRSASAPGMVYLHPYDFDAACPRLPGAPLLFRMLRYAGVSAAWGRLDRVLRAFRFCPVADWLASQDGATNG